MKYVCWVKIFPLITVIIFAVWSVWPMILNPASIADIGKDGYLINWIINQSGNNLYSIISSDSIRDLQEGVKKLFDGNIFYPNRNVLVYSDAYFITGIWSVIWGEAVGNPGIASGLTLVIGQIFTMAISYLFWKEITGDRWAAVVGAVGVGLSVIRWHYQVHMQMWSMQWWLGSVYLYWKWKQTRNIYWLLGTSILIGLLAWESLLTMYFALFVIFLMSWKSLLHELRNLLLLGAITLTISAPILFRYYQTSREQNLIRSIRDAAHHGMSLDDLGKQFYSPGLFVLIGLALWVVKKKKITNKDLSWLVVVMFMSGILSLGPVLKWNDKTVKLGGGVPIPLPYAGAYYAVPGFGAFRTPSRWVWVSAWAGSGIVAIAVSRSKKKGVAVAACILVLVAGGGKMGKIISLPGYPGFPEVYRWLSTQSGNVILELPMGDENIEAERMYYSLIHQKNLLNGYSGFYPEDNRKLDGMIKAEETEEILSYIDDIGVDYLVVHTEDGGQNTYTKLIKTSGGIKVWENQVAVVYKL